MNARPALIPALFVTAALALAAAPAAAATRGFPVGGFDRVSSSIPYDVLVRTGGQPSVRAEGDADAIDRLDVAVVGGELRLGTHRAGFFNWGGSHHLKLYVTAPALTAATLSGPGNLSVDRARARRFTATLSGPGNLDIGLLETEDAALTLSGPGDITVAGHAQRLRIVGSGPGDVRAGKLFAYNADIVMSGPGDVDAQATRTASIVLNGPGDVRVTGGARCSVTKHGPGDVTCR